MGGTSTTSQTQNSTTNPWAQATPALTGILSQLQGNLGNTGLTGTEGGALSQIAQNGQNFSSAYAPRLGANASELLNGGGALDQTGAVNHNYQRFQDQTNPLASNTNYNPYDTPGFKTAIDTATADITNSTNGAFAAAGRDFSGANSQTLGRGIMQGIAPTIAAQYNQNVNNQQGAADRLFAGGNTNAGLLAGLKQQDLANKQVGAQAATQSLDAQNTGANAQLQAEASRLGIPVQRLGLLAQIGVPIAGLGGQSTGQSNGSNTMSGAQQFATIAGGIGSLGQGLFGGGGSGGGGGAIPGMARLISDRRAKEDITQVGTLFDGTPVYRYRYIGQPAFQIGLMAQDVEKVTPEAVGMIGEFKAVDYKLATDKAVGAA